MSTMVRALGTDPVWRVFALASRRRIRGVAYHLVGDAERFGRQLDWFVAQGYHSVTAAEIADAIHLGTRLPAKPLWITFDDGDASVVRTALPMLSARGMRATAFVCGAWIGSDELPWWTVVEAAVHARLVRPDDPSTPVDPANLVQVRMALKRCPDTERRRAVDAFTQRLREAGKLPASPQWSEADLVAWLAAGNDVGNHSWDHPVLDVCDPDEQRRQVRLAHERLSELAGRPIDVFAWPNGDSAPAARDELARLGYRLIADCDHRLVARTPSPTHVSRLRLDADADLARTRAIVSGAHSLVFHLQRRLTGRGESHAVT
jgi:peptidoglycan/xylan/chitin deacetylase (PgdA/CDA1 family)